MSLKLILSHGEKMSLVLVIERTDKPDSRKEIPIEKKLVIGQSVYCDVILDDKMIAKMQCQIELSKSGHVVVTNIDKKRDVFLNESKLKRSGIKKGDVLKIGPFILSIDPTKLTQEELDIINTEYEEFV